MAKPTWRLQVLLSPATDQDTRNYSHVFASITETRVVLNTWRTDYNGIRPHSAVHDRTPTEMHGTWVDSRGARASTEERKDRVET